MVGCKGYVSSALLGIIDAGFLQYISKSGTTPFTVHDGAVAPVNAIDLFEKGSHGVAAVTRTLKSASHRMLRELGSKLIDTQRQLIADRAIDLDGVAVSV